MASYSVADAKNGLPGLIDKAIAGDEVVITRHGKPVVELRAVAPATPPRHVSFEELRAFREAGPTLDIDSVELFRRMYEEDEI